MTRTYENAIKTDTNTSYVSFKSPKKKQEIKRNQDLCNGYAHNYQTSSYLSRLTLYEYILNHVILMS